ncbi:uncharacterized protein C5orf47 homolog isoform X2 [Ascaphus truei]|uniref:uncharacterized protein C5orf47 homolog isoform X2 n=1 Tax=Ascaphus truei TaxID=8439 RepID=UPI003F5A391B
MKSVRGRGRKPLPDNTSGKKIFRAVYVSRFGEHSSGCVLEYGLNRGAMKRVTSGDRRYGDERRPEIEERHSQEHNKRSQTEREERSRGTPGRGNNETLQQGGARKKGGTEPGACERAGSPEIPVLKQLGARRGGAERGPCQERGILKADAYDICEVTPGKRDGQQIKNRNKKSESHHAVFKVIAKMMEENENLRKRLLQCSQKCAEVMHYMIFRSHLCQQKHTD